MWFSKLGRLSSCKVIVTENEISHSESLRTSANRGTVKSEWLTKTSHLWQLPRQMPRGPHGGHDLPCFVGCPGRRMPMAVKIE